MTDWDKIWMSGTITIRERIRNGHKQAPRREINFCFHNKKRKFTYARVVWNVMNPDDLAGPHDDVHHEDGNTLNDCPENLKKENLHTHRSRKKNLSEEQLSRYKHNGARQGRWLWDQINSGKRISPYGVKFDLEQAIKLRASGLAPWAIGKAIGAFHSNLYYFFKKYDLDSKIQDGTIWEWFEEYKRSKKERRGHYDS
jgi:hypothetical protein